MCVSWCSCQARVTVPVGGAHDESCAPAGRRGSARPASISWSSRVAAARPQATTSVCTAGQRRLEVCGDLDVVEAGDRQVARAPRHRGRRRATARPSPSGRWRRPRRSAARRGRAGRAWPRAPDSAEKSASTQTPSGSPASRSAWLQAVAARAAVHHLRRAGDVRDVAVCPRPTGARRRHGCRVRRRRPRADWRARGCSPRCGADHHRREPELLEQRGPLVVDLEVGDEHAVDAALLHQPAVGRVVVLLGDLQQQRVPAGGQHRLETGDERGEERVGAQDLRRAGDHQADGERLGDRQRPGPRAGRPAERLRGLEDPRPGLRGDPRPAVQREGDGALGHARSASPRR